MHIDYARRRVCRPHRRSRGWDSSIVRKNDTRLPPHRNIGSTRDRTRPHWRSLRPRYCHYYHGNNLDSFLWSRRWRKKESLLWRTQGFSAVELNKRGDAQGIFTGLQSEVKAFATSSPVKESPHTGNFCSQHFMRPATPRKSPTFRLFYSLSRLMREMQTKGKEWPILSRVPLALSENG